MNRSWRVLVALAVVAVVLVPGGAAFAQPSLEEIEAEIDAAWRELEPTIEKYNKVRSELEENQEASDELAEKIAPLAEDATAAAGEISEMAVRQYKAGPSPGIGALLTNQSPTAFVDQLATLDKLAREQQQDLDEASEVLAGYQAEKAELDALIEEQEEQEEELAERAEAIEDDLADLEEMRDEAQAAEPQSQPETTPEPSGSCPAEASSGPGAAAAEFACGELGKPYEYGASGPGSYDCSGLTQAAWAAAGVSLTHYTGAQWEEGQAVSRENAVPGDLVFFYSDLSHVSLYVGGGMIVDAPHSGDVVKMRSIDVMPLAGIRRPG